jgi:hypothetical protein
VTQTRVTPSESSSTCVPTTFPLFSFTLHTARNSVPSHLQAGGTTSSGLTGKSLFGLSRDRKCFSLRWLALLYPPLLKLTVHRLTGAFQLFAVKTNKNELRMNIEEIDARLETLGLRVGCTDGSIAPCYGSCRPNDNTTCTVDEKRSLILLFQSSSFCSSTWLHTALGTCWRI